MKTIYDPKEPLEFESVATIGIFDGVHTGHRKIIDTIKKEAETKGLSSLVVTFYPHPQAVITGKTLPMIIPLGKRFKLLEGAGVDAVVCFTFTEEFSRMTAKQFVVDVLATRLRVKSLFVGPDFTFGRDREGDIELLERLGRCAGFEMHVVEPVSIDGSVVSSTAIRSLLEAGRVREASEYLGCPYVVDGRVVEGEKRGRTLGFPTANLATEWELLPRVGVYATLAHFEGARYPSMTNVGTRPTFGENELLIETHIFDFDRDIYGKSLTVEFVDRIRDEQKFAGVDALVAQIKKDSLKAREIASSAL